MGQSLISRYDGASKFKDANNTVIHTIILTFIVSIIILIIGVFFLKDLIILFSEKEVLTCCLSYGQIIFLLNILFLLPNVTTSIFRTEEEIKLATNLLILTAIINIILDPIFIYILNQGIYESAMATIITSFIKYL